MRGVRKRERLHARAIAVLVAAHLGRMTVHDLDDNNKHEVHTDPRAHLSAVERCVNDVDGLLEEAAALEAKRMALADDEWSEHATVNDIDSPIEGI